MRAPRDLASGDRCFVSPRIIHLRLQPIGAHMVIAELIAEGVHANFVPYSFAALEYAVLHESCVWRAGVSYRRVACA